MKQAASLIGLIALAACSQTQDKSLSTAGNSPQSLMAGVARQVQACWFKKKLPALAPYKMATELDSYSGKPRILIVPKDNPGGLPKLVAQAERISGRNTFTTFGPLLSSNSGPKLNASLRAWAKGSRTC